MNVQRVRRMLTILSVLQNPYGRNATSLAGMCGVSKRTVFRDLRLLKEAGLPLLFDERNERYTLGSNPKLPLRPFEPLEALALIVLCHENARSQNVPLLEYAASAAMKLETMLPHAVRQYVQPRAGAIAFGPRPVGCKPRSAELFPLLIDAVADRRSVRLAYESVADEAEITFKLNPYKIVHCRHAWYVVGRSSIHRAVRTFHLARISKFELLEDTFEIPRGFSVDKYFGAAWSMIREPGRPVPVVVKFGPRVARNASEVTWHPSQRCEVLDDGSMLFTAHVAGVHEIAWWILGYGDQAEVLEPESLKDLIRKHIDNMRRYYFDKPQRSV